MLLSQPTPNDHMEQLDDPFNSDHFPIITKINIAQERKKHHRKKFNKTVDEELSKRPSCENANKEANNPAKSLRVAANASIPQSSNKIKKHVPWWNKTFADLRNQKMMSWHILQKYPTQQNLLEYKKRNAFFRREMKHIKKLVLKSLPIQLT